MTDTPGQRLSGRQFDVTIVGGGVHGAGVAQAAAAAGYTTLLIEKYGWASGTSSKSSKLIHGGLRYLQSGQLGLVRESLQERQTLLTIAPHLVQLKPFHIPVYTHSRYRPWQLTIGLALYFALGGLRKTGRFRSLPQKQWPQLEGLKKEGLQRVFEYHDAQTDDAELTRAVVSSAASLGAELACPATVTSVVQDADCAVVSIASEVEKYRITTRVLINCAGPWINDVAALIQPSPSQIPIELVQGTHLVLSNPVARSCYYLESPSDGRAVFLLPWQGQSLLGTTETVHVGDPAEAKPLPAEETYLLAILRNYFPNTEPIVTSRMAGLRVLPKTAKSPFRRTREVSLVADRKINPRYVAVYGGKLTGYRATADKVVAMIEPTLGTRSRKADTRTLVLPNLLTGPLT